MSYEVDVVDLWSKHSSFGHNIQCDTACSCMVRRGDRCVDIPRRGETCSEVYGLEGTADGHVML